MSDQNLPPEGPDDAMPTDVPADPHGRIDQVDLELEMQRSYLDYAMSVIVGRALPDVRDGLKPVHRRILYAMYDGGYRPNAGFYKCMRVVGDVLAHYHPHGDASVYDALARLVQPWSMRYPLVAGQGNFGSPGNLGPAAPRYTECKMAPLAMELVRDIDEDTVDFQDNYDGRSQEPVVLPARFPNLLVNGSEGIAVGMATRIPPHNLREVAAGVQWALAHPEATREELLDALMARITGPDFPTGATILGRRGIEDAYRTGRGSIIQRAIVDVEEIHGRTCLVVKALPYQVNPDNLVVKIAEFAKSGQVQGIADIRDETSGRHGLRLIIVLKRDAVAKVVLNNLYKRTQLQDSFPANMLALVDGHPRILNLKQILYYYLKHQEEVITRRSRYELEKAEAKAHILEGLLIALDHIDEVIRTIRESRTDEVAKTALISKFGLSEKQAVAILDMRLRRLTGLERDKIEADYKDVQETIAYLRDLLSSREKIMGVVKAELTDEKNNFGDKRRTEIAAALGDMDVTDLIPDKPMTITLTKQNYIKRIDSSDLRTQKKGGRGVSGLKMKDGDYVRKILTTSTHDRILFFTNKGKVYMKTAYDIPESSRTARGSAMINFITSLGADEHVTELLDLDISEEGTKYLLMVTKYGYIKKTALEEYKNINKNGLIAMRLKDEDRLVAVLPVKGNEEIIMGTRKGMAIRFSIDDDNVRPLSRSASGVHGMRLKEGDDVVGVVVAAEKDIFTISADGNAKRNAASAYRLQGRNGQGTINFKKGYEVVALVAADDRDELVGISEQGITIRIPADQISSKKAKGGQGVILQRLEEGDRIASIDVVSEPEEDEENS